MAEISKEQFKESPQPGVYKAFSPLQPGEPTTYDPSGWENTTKQPAWTKNARILGRRRHSKRFGDSYSRDNLTRSGYNREELNSTMED